MRTRWLLLFAWAALIGCPLTAKAQLQLTFNPDMQTIISGGTVDFSGTLSNVSNSEVFLNGDAINLTGSGFTIDDSPFQLNAPLSLTAVGTINSSYTGLLFTVSTAMVMPGLYFGSFVVDGGATSSSSDTVATQTFAINVLPAAVPEPGNLMLLTGIGMTWVMYLARRRIRHIF